MLDDAVDERREAICVAEGAVMDVVEDGGELWVELILRVQVRVAQVLDVFGEVAEKEDVLLADFTGDFDLEQSQSLYVRSTDEYLRSHRHKYR